MGCRRNRKFGIMLGSIGIGIVAAVILPIWGWLLAVGAGLIYLGWWILGRCR